MRAIVSSLAIGAAIVSMSSCTMQYDVTFNDDYSGHYETYMVGLGGGNPYSEMLKGLEDATDGLEDSLHVDKYITDDMPKPSDTDPFSGGFDSLFNDISVEKLRQIPGLSNINYQWSDSTSDKMFKTSFDFADISALNAGIAQSYDSEKTGEGLLFEISKKGRKMSYRFKTPENSDEFDAFRDGEFDFGGMDMMMGMMTIKMRFTYPKKIKKVNTNSKYRLSNDDHTVTVKHSLDDILNGTTEMNVKLKRF